MADVRVNRPTAQREQHMQGRGEQGQRGVARRESLPSMFNFSPGEFFSANPFALMRRLTEDMDRTFSTWAGSRGGGGGTEMTGMWMPPIEVYEQDNKLKIRAELPGIDKDQVQVEVQDGNLIIQGERRQEQTEERQGVVHSERIYGRFYRSVPLPEEAKVDDAQAEYKNGILEITVPIPESAHRSRQIPISGETSGGKKTQAA
jgi:HSP20 family protein